MDDEVPAIYERLLGACRHARLSGKYSAVHLDADIRVNTKRMPSVVAELQRDFSTDALQRAGVCLPPAEHSDSPIRLHSALQRPGSLLIVLRAEADDKPFDIVTSHGVLSGSGPSLFAVHQDYRFLDAAESGYVYLTASTWDLALLRTLGLAAALLDGLATIGGSHLDQLSDLLAWNRSGRECESYDRWLFDRNDAISGHPQLAVVGSPHTGRDEEGPGNKDPDVGENEEDAEARLKDNEREDAEFEAEMTRQWRFHSLSSARLVVLDRGLVVESDYSRHIARLLAHLRLLQRDLGLTVPDICICRPQLDERRLRTALSYGTPADIQETIRSSLENKEVVILPSEVDPKSLTVTNCNSDVVP